MQQVAGLLRPLMPPSTPLWLTDVLDNLVDDLVDVLDLDEARTHPSLQGSADTQHRHRIGAVLARVSSGRGRRQAEIHVILRRRRKR